MFLDTVTVDASKLADQLAKIAGPIAKHGWEVYVRQQYVIGFQEVFLAVLCLVGLVGSVLAVRWAITEHEKELGGADDDLTLVVLVFGVIFCIFTVPGLVAWGMDALAHLVNPEYGAIQGILGR